jgi:hypothetical protein
MGHTDLGCNVCGPEIEPGELIRKDIEAMSPTSKLARALKPIAVARSRASATPQRRGNAADGHSGLPRTDEPGPRARSTTGARRAYL